MLHQRAGEPAQQNEQPMDGGSIKKDINYFELQAIFNGLKSFAQELQSVNILLRTDMSYINCEVQFPDLNQLA